METSHPSTELALQVVLHEYDAVAREALRYHAQLQRVTQFVLVAAGLGAPFAVSGVASRPLSQAGSTVPAALPASLVLLALGSVFLILSVMFEAYFRALVVNMSYRWTLQRKVSWLLGAGDTLGANGPLGYRQYVEDWCRPPWSASTCSCRRRGASSFSSPTPSGRDASPPPCGGNDWTCSSHPPHLC